MTQKKCYMEPSLEVLHVGTTTLMTASLDTQLHDDSPITEEEEILSRVIPISPINIDIFK